MYLNVIVSHDRLTTPTPDAVPSHPVKSLAFVAVLGFCAVLGLQGCSGGSDAMSRTMNSAQTEDLDTAKPPPSTVSKTPLLPPVPNQPAEQQADAVIATPPLEYDHLYSDEDQERIRRELSAAAAKLQ